MTIVQVPADATPEYAVQIVLNSQLIGITAPTASLTHARQELAAIEIGCKGSHLLWRPSDPETPGPWQRGDDATLRRFAYQAAHQVMGVMLADPDLPLINWHILTQYDGSVVLTGRCEGRDDNRTVVADYAAKYGKGASDVTAEHGEIVAEFTLRGVTVSVRAYGVTELAEAA